MHISVFFIIQHLCGNIEFMQMQWKHFKDREPILDDWHKYDRFISLSVMLLISAIMV